MQCVIAKKSKFLKEQEAKGLLSIVGLKTPFSQIPLLDPLNEIVNKFLLAGDNVILKCI